MSRTNRFTIRHRFEFSYARRVVLVLALSMLPWLALAASGVSVIPLPQRVQFSSGLVNLPDGTEIRYPAADAAAASTAAYLAAAMEQQMHVHWVPAAIGSTSDSGAAIILAVGAQAPLGQAESYRLQVDDSTVRIVAGDEAGLFYGAVTLLQLATANPEAKQVQLAQGQIDDWPQFEWRGLMIDSVRHFQSVAELQQIIDQMALHKLNRLHWHLTDDQGWRIEIKRYPDLTHIGAWRQPPHAGQNGEPARYGGFYTQDQIRQLVAYAAERHITIMPELDLPGHAQAAVASYPQLGVSGQRPAVGVNWGVNPYLYSPGPASIRFVENVLDEVLGLFPSRYIDLGGDEAIKGQWRDAPEVQRQLRQLKLANEDALQGWMMGQLAGYLSLHGRQLVGWDEILQGGQAPADATVMSWRGNEGALAAVASGHDVIMSPAPDLYFDQLQSANDDEISGRQPVRSLADIYAFQVVPPQLNPEQAPHVLGAQANVWTEHLSTAQHLQHAIFPRLDALSEVLWTAPAQRSWPDFLSRLPTQLAHYRRAGIDYSDSAFAPQLNYDRDQAVQSGRVSVQISNQVASGDFRYTLDGQTPGPKSPLYRHALSLTLPANLEVASFSADGQPWAAVRHFVLDRNQALSLSASQLQACDGGQKHTSRVLPEADASGLAPVYEVNLMNSCWRYPPTRLDPVRSIALELARLPRNYALGDDAAKVVSYPPGSRFGQIRVYLDRCQGEALQSLDLPDPNLGPARFKLQAGLPPLQGRHALCLLSSAPPNGPLYGIGSISLGVQQ